MAVITDRRILKSTIDKKSSIYSHRPPSYVSHDLITKGNHLLVMFYGDKWRTFRRFIHQHLTENMVEHEHLSIVNAEAIQLVRDYMVSPEDHMLHPKRFSNSITNSIGLSIILVLVVVLRQLVPNETYSFWYSDSSCPIQVHDPALPPDGILVRVDGDWQHAARGHLSLVKGRTSKTPW